MLRSTVFHMRKTADARDRALRAFRRSAGWLRQPEIRALGVHPRWLTRLVAEGTVERVCKGLYRLPSVPSSTDESFADIARAVPHGVVCLLSALAHHGLTTANPSEVYLAVPKGSWRPRVAYPPIRYFRFSPRMMRIGVERVRTRAGEFSVFDREKSICDALRHVHVVGRDVVLGALRAYLADRRARDVDKLLATARECRVERRLRPYLEALA